MGKENKPKVNFDSNNNSSFEEFWKFFVLSIGEEEIEKMWAQATTTEQFNKSGDSHFKK